MPIDNSKVPRLDVSLRPSLTLGRDTFTYYDGMKRIPEGTAPDFKNKSHSITVDVEIGEGGNNDGMLVTQGGRFGGWGLYVLDGKPVYLYNVANLERYRVASSQKLTPGQHTIRYEFAYDGGAKVRAEPELCSSTASRSRPAQSSEPWAFGFRWTRRLTSAPTPVNR